MLDKQSRKVLKYLLSLADDINSIDDCSDLCAPQYSWMQTLDSIRYLDDTGYIKVSYAMGSVPHKITIDYPGLHYRDFDWIKLKSFLLRSVLVPIIVSFFTALFANLLF